jgi:hypothetical protein
LADIIAKYEDRFEFVYREALILFKKSKNFSLALPKIEKYIQMVANRSFSYEVIKPMDIKIQIEKLMKIKQF